MNDAIIHARLLEAFHKRYGIIPDYESILECNYRRLIGPGDTVIDIGAHLGRHTSVFAEIVGPTGTVWAFEPLAQQFSILKALNLGSHVKLLNVAVSDQAGRSSFVHARGTPSESGLRQRIYNVPDVADPETIQVDVVRLDDFLGRISSLHFVKIDVEGGEIGCLRGAVNLLRRLRPFVAVEYRACRTPSMGTRDAHFSISLSRPTLLSVTFSAAPVRTLRRGTLSATGCIGTGSLFPTNGSANGSRISRFEFAAHFELFGIRSRRRIQYCFPPSRSCFIIEGPYSAGGGYVKRQYLTPSLSRASDPTLTVTW